MSARRRPGRAAAGGLALIAALALAGCTGLFRSKLPPDQIYTLGAPPPAAAVPVAGPAAGTGQSAPSLAVAPPVAAPGLDTSRIVLLRPDHRMDVFAASRWPAPLPEVVEALAVQQLRASGAWSAVADPGSPFPADYVLAIAIRRFEAEYAAEDAAPTVTVALDCTVGLRTGRGVIATFTASASAPAAANRMSAIVAAFGQATDTALATLAGTTLAAVRADVASHGEPGATPQNGAAPAASSSR